MPPGIRLSYVLMSRVAGQAAYTGKPFPDLLRGPEPSLTIPSPLQPGTPNGSALQAHQVKRKTGRTAEPSVGLDLRQVFREQQPSPLEDALQVRIPPRRAPTVVVHRVHVGLAVDELRHHPLHRQARSQDQGCGAIIHPGIQVGHSVSDQDLEEKAQGRESPASSM